MKEAGMRAQRLLFGLMGINVAVSVALLAQTGRTSAAGVPDTVRARAIELVDERGQVRAQIDVEPSGEAVFRLRDSSGQIRVKLGASGDGSGLLLLDASTEPAIHMLAKNRETSVTLAGQNGRRRTITP
jgi:hypothetical protein